MKTEKKQKEWEALTPIRRKKLTDWFEGSLTELVAIHTTKHDTTYSVWENVSDGNFTTYDLVRSFGIGDKEAISVDVSDAEADTLIQKLLEMIAE